MGFGFFGKVPQKGDFITQGMPPTVLRPLEEWLQAAVAASRAVLGDSWLDHYLVAPIWHFWLPPAVLGLGCTGAIMPSVDAAGRYFPASLLHAASAPVAHPADWDSAGWYAAVDNRLLTILDADDADYLPMLLADLDPPASIPSSGEGIWWRGTFGAPEAIELRSGATLPPPSAYTAMLTD